MLTLLSSSLGGKPPVATHREMLSLSDLDDHLLRDIGLRRIELHAVPVERFLPSCCSRAARRWAEFVTRVRNVLSSEPILCCRT